MIARISPRDGHVVAWIDLKGLLPAEQRIDEEAVLNGIAYDAKYDRIFVTGKRWPTVFQIEVVQRPR
jgi:glutamine cyclotransferase